MVLLGLFQITDTVQVILSDQFLVEENGGLVVEVVLEAVYLQVPSEAGLVIQVLNETAVLVQDLLQIMVDLLEVTKFCRYFLLNKKN